MQKYSTNKISKMSQRKGFTLIELIVTIGVLSLGILAVIALSGKSYGALSLQKNKLIGMNLAKEGIEIMRNIRDENWLYTESSHCDSNSTPTVCADGRVEQDGSDCDWRCGSKNIIEGNPGFFRMDENFRDLDRNGDVVIGSGAATDCQTDGVVIKKAVDDSLQHTSGTSTIFKRLISINRNLDLDNDGNSDNDIQIKISVCWTERGDEWRSVFLEDHLYNWK